MDLILTGGRVIDPSQNLDAVTEVGFANGKVVAWASRWHARPPPLSKT
jgi:dihydroorotase